ncbi:MAG: NmrA family NAD(P)-binding protein, partial [Cytophagales bacterium]|nr:NmrA family NAD(P)-binding protein [Cytophagales bacterium]
LLAAGKDVTVVGRSLENLKPLIDRGAKYAVGSLEDGDFLVEAFKNKQVAYVLIPGNFAVKDFRAYQNLVGKNIANAIQKNGVKHVVFLSSTGAHMGNGAGVVDGLADFEKLLAAIPGLNAKILRPGFFYYNFFQQIGTIKAMGIMGSNYAGNITIPFTDTTDIGNIAAEELLNPNFTGISFRYIVSDETTPQHATTILGTAIGKPDMPWVQFPDDQMKSALLQAGLQESLVDGYVQLGQAFQSGEGQADYIKNKPAPSPTKLTDFAKEFAAAFAAA